MNWIVELQYDEIVISKFCLMDINRRMNKLNSDIPPNKIIK